MMQGCWLILVFWTCWNSLPFHQLESLCACMVILPIPWAWGFIYRHHSEMKGSLLLWTHTTSPWVVFGCQCSGHLVRSFKFLDFKSNLKLGLSSVGKMYMVCSIMQNALSCMYGNQTSEYFDWDPLRSRNTFLNCYCKFCCTTPVLTPETS